MTFLLHYKGCQLRMAGTSKMLNEPQFQGLHMQSCEEKDAHHSHHETQQLMYGVGWHHRGCVQGLNWRDQ